MKQHTAVETINITSGCRFIDVDNDHHNALDTDCEQSHRQTIQKTKQGRHTERTTVDVEAIHTEARLSVACLIARANSGRDAEAKAYRIAREQLRGELDACTYTRCTHAGRYKEEGIGNERREEINSNAFRCYTQSKRQAWPQKETKAVSRTITN